MSGQQSKARHGAQIVLITLFLIISLLPVLSMFVIGETQPSANEILASKPKLLDRSGKLNTHVLNDFSDYIADRFAFRKQLVTAWARLNAALFHSSAEDQVVLGTDGWLYYAPTLDDYIGRAMSAEELAHAAAYLASLQRAAENRGATFVFTIAPNKNSLYGENMPSYIPENHHEANAVRLRPYLEEYGVNYVDLFSVFTERGEVLYYRTDSHWTECGAALAADSLLSAAGKDTSYFDGPYSAGVPHLGDLYEMLYPAGNEPEESERYAPGFAYSLSGDARGGNAMKIRSSCEGREGVLLCWRDSFGISLYPYLADSFSEASFLRETSYDPALIDETGADIVILEIVERNLSQLADRELVD